LVLGLICYCNKAGTDIYQRNSLEQFSFTFCLFNWECRYKTAAWHTLGYIPDFQNMSSTKHCISCSGCIGKSWSISNFHCCFETILNPLETNKVSLSLHMQTFILVTRLLCVEFSFLLLMLWEMVSVPIKCAVFSWVIQMSTD